MAIPFIPLAVLALGIGAAVYYTREAAASEPAQDTGPPSNFATAATVDEYSQLLARLNTQAKPIVFIVFKPGQVPFEAIQSAAMGQARAYPEIWVVMVTHQAAVDGGGGEGVGRNCGPNDGGSVATAPYGGGQGSEIYVACWPQGADAVTVKQNINIAAIEAKNLAAMTPNA